MENQTCDLSTGIEGSPGSASERYLLHFMRLLSLLALSVSALVYPWQVSVRVYTILHDAMGFFPGGAKLFEAIRPYLMFEFSPLVIKETLTSWVLLPFVASWISWRILYRSRQSRRFRPEFLCLFLFMIWTLLSVRWAPQFGLDSALIYKCFNVSLWSLFLAGLMDLPGWRRYSGRSALCIVLLGLVMMLVSVGAAVEETARYVFQILPRIDTVYKRNLFGGLIGHNTGVASICMGPFFFALGHLFLTRRWVGRMLSLCYAVLALYFFLVTQSRAVWLLFLMLTPLFLLGLRPLIGAPVRLRHFLYGGLLLLLFVVLQLIPARWNILHIEEAQFTSRLRALTPQVLLSETRLRILAVTMPLIAERPMVGHGFGSFVSVYPRAQAEYFSRHPDSVLYPSFHLSQHAHNDLLQLQLETGLIGTALAFIVAFLLFRRGLARFRKLSSREERLRRYCAFFALVGILLHALVDFPFHIVPLVTFLLFYCAMAYGSPEEDSELPAARRKTDSEPVARNRMPRPGHVMLLVVAMLAWAACIPGVLMGVRRLQADRYLNRGMQHMNFYEANMGSVSAEQLAESLKACRMLLRESLRIDPLDFTPAFFRGIASTFLADLIVENGRTARRMGLHDQERLIMNEARNMAENAIDQLRQAARMDPESGDPESGVLANHTIFHHLARSWSLLAEADPTRAEAARRQAFTFFQLAVHYSPTYSLAIVETIDFMGQHQMGAIEQRWHYLGLLARYDQMRFLWTYLGRVRKLLDEDRLDAAGALLNDLYHAVASRDDCIEVYETRALYFSIRGDLRGHREITDEMRRKFPFDARVGGVIVNDLILSRQFVASLSVIEAMEQDGIEIPENLLLTKAELLKQTGREAEGEALSGQVIAASDWPSAAYASRGSLRIYLFHDRESGLADYREALKFEPSVLPGITYLMLAREYIRQGDLAAAEAVMDLAKERGVRNMALEQLRSRLTGAAAETDQE